MSNSTSCVDFVDRNSNGSTTDHGQRLSRLLSISTLDSERPDIDRPISDILIGEQHGSSTSIGPAFARGASLRRTPSSSAINAGFCTGFYDHRVADSVFGLDFFALLAGHRT